MARDDTDAAQNDPLIGKRLASYEVLARVARGGMGVVYRARHVYIDKIVALKVLDPALVSRPELIERFRTEAQSLARVEHENVVKVIDILEDEGVHFIVMDFAEGVNLRNHVKQNGPMPGDELLSVARQSAEALYAAHREGILHRDIKPENLIMNRSGRCKLADFGLAGDLRLISEGHEGPLNFGTPAYSAPEVLRKMVPDKRSDIFSYGATLYYLATGEPPFGQTGAQQILLRQKQGAELLEGKRPDLPGKLVRVIMDCLAWHPKERPESFREVMERLPRRAVSRAVAATATGTTPTEATGLVTSDSATIEVPPRGAPWLAAAAIALGAGALLTVALVWWLTRDPGTGPIAVENAPLNAPRNDPPRNLSANNAPPANTPDQPPPVLPEEEAFNAAELDSRTALARADYKAAYNAWSAFVRAYPDSEFVAEATRRRGRVMARVLELRVSEYNKAREACDAALGEKRTADAMAAINRFPVELLVPLHSEDDVTESALLDAQRHRVIAADTRDLELLLERCDTLRNEWKGAQERRDTAPESTLLRVSSNLLKERDSIENFLPGRLEDTQEKLGKRLSELRKLLESTHQDAHLHVEAWRKFMDLTLAEWSLWLVERADRIRGLAARREFGTALAEVRSAESELAGRLAALKTGSVLADARAREVRILGRCLALMADDIRLADGAHALVETQLRALQRAGTSREFMVHAEIDSNGERSARLTRYMGKVVAVGNGEFKVDTDSQRATVRIDMLSAATLRRLLRALEKPSEQLSLIAWCALQGRAEDAQQELARLETMSPAAGDLERARALVALMQPSPSAMRALAYLACKGGLKDRDWFAARAPGESTESLLLARQAGAAAGNADDAQRYIELVRTLEDPELVHIGAFAGALATGQPFESDLRNRTLLEPFSAEALAALAVALKPTDLHGARLLAQKALVRDASNEAAWSALK